MNLISMKKLGLAVVVVFLLAGVSFGSWSFDTASKTFVLEPELVAGDVFYQKWVPDNYDPTPYMFLYDGYFRTDSEYGGDPFYCVYFSSQGDTTGLEMKGDYRLISSDGPFYALRGSNYYNAYALDLELDLFLAYKLGEGDFIDYFNRDNWDLGSTPGTGYGVYGHWDTEQAFVGGNGKQLNLRFGMRDFWGGDRWFTEWYGSGWRVWGGSAQTEYNDNYITDPFADGQVGGPIWSSQRVEHSGGSLTHSEGGAGTMEAIYLVAHDKLLSTVDVRLVDTDKSGTSLVVYAGSGDCKLNIAVGPNETGPWTDIWSSTTSIYNNDDNAGGTADFTGQSTRHTFVKVYTTSSGSHYAWWEGFKVELTSRGADDCDELWDVTNKTLYQKGDFNEDGIINVSDLALFVADWLNCNDPLGGGNCITTDVAMATDIGGSGDCVVDLVDYAELADNWYDKKVLTIDDFENGREWLWEVWSWSDAGVFNGVEVNDVNPYAGTYCGKFWYEMSEDASDATDAIAGFYYFDDLPSDATELRFQVRADNDVKIVVVQRNNNGGIRTTGGVWTTLEEGTMTILAASGWQQKTVTLNGSKGRLGFKVLDNFGPASGAVYLDNIEVVTTATDAELSDYYWANFKGVFGGQPGQLFYDGSVDCQIIASPASWGDIELELTGDVYDAEDNLVHSLTPAILDSANNWGMQITDIPNGLGYYRVDLQLTDTANPAHTIDVNSRYAVIPPNPSLGIKDLDSPFGVNAQWGQYHLQTSSGEIAKRAGIEWIRGVDHISKKRSFYVCKKNKLCFMPVVQLFNGAVTFMFKDTLDSDPGFPRSGPGSWDYTCAWNMADDTHPDFNSCTDLLARMRDYADQYGDYVDAYNIWNEPTNFPSSLPWDDALGGSWSGGAWTETFVDWGKQVSDEIRSQDPTAPIVWDDVDSLIWYDDFYGHGATTEIDVISPHPYSPSHGSVNPEEQFIIPKQTEWSNFILANSLDWEIWSGEVGDPTSGTSGWHIVVTELEQAQYLTRMMTVQLDWGVKKIFYYCFTNRSDNGITDPSAAGDNFGLVRADYLPKPALVAYSYLISRMRDYDSFGRINSSSLNGASSDVYAYKLTEDGATDPTLIIGSTNGNAETVNITVTSGVTQVSVKDIFGTDKGTIAVVGGNLQITANEQQKYIDGLKQQDLP